MSTECWSKRERASGFLTAHRQDSTTQCHSRWTFSGKYRTEDKFKIQSMHKLNTNRKTKQHKTQQNNCPCLVVFCYNTRPGNQVDLFNNVLEPTWGSVGRSIKIDKFPREGRRWLWKARNSSHLWCVNQLLICCVVEEAPWDQALWSGAAVADLLVNDVTSSDCLNARTLGACTLEQRCHRNNVCYLFIQRCLV